MKHVFLLTDFSAKARNAAAYAVRLFDCRTVSFTLINAFDIEYCGTPYISQLRNDLANDSVENLNDEREYLLTIAPEARIEVAARFGRLVDVVNAENAECPADFAVAGCEDESVLENFLLGSNTYELIKFADMPIVVVPGKAAYERPTRVTFATDMLTVGNEVQLRRTAELIGSVGSEVMFLNVAEAEPSDNDEAKAQLASAFNASDISFTKIRMSDVRKGILDFMDERKSQMCALIHRDLGLIDRMFRPSITKKMILEPQHPMIIVRS